MQKSFEWRLALDMGTNSIGWACFAITATGQETVNKKTGEVKHEYKPTSLFDLGVSLFSDGREPAAKGRIGDSLAVARRQARGMRRNRDRRLKRKQHLMNALVACGLMPVDKVGQKAIEQINPYMARSEAAEHAVDSDMLARALWHLGLRRGFKSNRKTDGDEEKGKIKPKIGKLDDILQERNITLGQYLYQQLENQKSIRFRGEEETYPSRAMYEMEFNHIRDMQSAHHDLSPDDWERIKDIIFFQRDLLPVERGRCTFYPQEYRAYKALPIAHVFRIWQEINNLRIFDENLSLKVLNSHQKQAIFNLLHRQKSASFNKIRQLKDKNGVSIFSRECRFNLEDDKREKLNGHETACIMRDKNHFGDLWDEIPTETQNNIVETLITAEQNDVIMGMLNEYNLSLAQKNAIATVRLSDGVASVSCQFMMELLPYLEQGMRYDEAAEAAGFHHSDLYNNDLLDKLPYYGMALVGSTMGGNPEINADEFPEKHYGRIANPTVHVALNQLRRLVNALIDRYGRPYEIVIEVTRELKKSREARKNQQKAQAENQKQNDRIAKIIKECTGSDHASIWYIKKVKLWEELGDNELARQCPFTGRNISACQLFNGEVEIEHILPFAKSLDNSMNNLTVAFRHANRAKGNMTPYEAAHKNGWDWDAILERAEAFKPAKSARFAPDAMERFFEENDFLARQLTDTAYIARIAKRYLARVTDKNNIWATPGLLTDMMRGKWYLNQLLSDHNKKNREDHRHHAIDAFVIGLTDRGLLYQVSNQSKKRGKNDRLEIDLPDLGDLYDQLKEKLGNLIVTQKPDHGHLSRFYKETAYGQVRKPVAGLDGYDLVTRKPITTLKETELGMVRDPIIRGQLLDIFKDVVPDIQNGRTRELLAEYFKGDPKTRGGLVSQQCGQLVKAWVKKHGVKLEKLLADFSHDTGIKRMRLLASNQSVQEIKHGNGFYKYYALDGVACCDIWRVPGKVKDGEQTYKYVGDYLTYVDAVHEDKAHRNSDYESFVATRKPHPAAKRMMRLYKNDMVELDGEVYRVAAFSTTNNKVALTKHNSANSPTNFQSINIIGKSLKKLILTADGKLPKR